MAADDSIPINYGSSTPTANKPRNELAEHFRCSRKTICRHLKKATAKNRFAAPDAVNLIMDTTYFGRSFGIMVLYDSISNQALSVDEVTYETNAPYLEAVCKLEQKGITIQSIT